ncbi:MAG TPA: hypothetical protein VEZ11_06320 [Thermoanaerobaculia bacterium]|nr:hypothetical protein [Thermoanaerobaculia bacterium]
MAVTFLAMASEPALGQEPRYLLDVEGANPGKEIVVSRPADGLFPIRLILNVAPDAPPPKPVRVIMSQFSGDRGSFAVDVLSGCDAQSALVKQPIDFTASRMQALCLRIPSLPGEGRYTGSMLFLSDDAKPLVKPFVITSPQATLVAQSISPQWVTLPIWGRFAREGPSAAPQQTFTIVLSEKSGVTSVRGIMVGLTVTKSPSGFDLKRNIRFRIKGQDVPNLESGPPTQQGQEQLRTVRAGGQLGVDVSLYGLVPGEYNAVLRFSSPNSVADDSQKQNLVIQVRDPVVWPILWLLAAVSISFIATKVLTGLRRRADLQRQIHDLTPQWFSSLAFTAAVVWVRAALHQARRLSSRFWLTSADLIETQVNGVRSMLKILDQAHQLRGLLSRALDEFLLRRVLIDLDNAVSGLDAGAPDDATASRIQTDLKAFEDWLAKDKVLAKFQSDVIPSITALETEIATGKIPDAAREIIGISNKAVQDALLKPLATTLDMNVLYREYAALRALWDGRDDPADLIASPSLMDLLRVTDERSWQRLKTANLSIRVPASSSPDGLEAYVPLQFSVESIDPRVAASYLFKHKVEYAWIFTLKPERRGFRERMHLKKPPATVTLKPVSLGPAVVQYFPRAGTVQVEVALRYHGESLAVPARADLEIRDSSDFGFLRSFEAAEVGSWLIAAGAAIVTGLSTFYFKSQFFGSYQDYISLFIWGVGIDQTKNFVQNMQAFSTTPPAGQAH